MPTIANPRGIGTYEQRRSQPGPGETPASSLRLRMKVATRLSTLTEQLAEGVDPTSTPELALRASQLTSPRQRRLLARTLRRMVREARDPAVTRGSQCRWRCAARPTSGSVCPADAFTSSIVAPGCEGNVQGAVAGLKVL